MATNFIKCNILRINPEKLQSTIHFYKDICGMGYNVEQLNFKNSFYTSSDNKLHVFTFPSKESSYKPTGVGFVLDTEHKVDYANSGYWKVGFGLRDVDAAVRHMHRHSIQVGGESQFYDVGYLTCLDDPNGHNIEVLQHDFERNFTPPADSNGLLSQPLGDAPVLGQITIRCTDAVRTQKFYENVLGMKLMCVEQPANKLPFSLYFFAYTDEQPPSVELSAVENREWLYKRPYCQIEVQHRHNLPPGHKYVTNDDNGPLSHVGFCVCVSEDVMLRVKACEGVKVCVDSEGKDVCFVRDPDGYVIQVVAL